MQRTKHSLIASHFEGVADWKKGFIRQKGRKAEYLPIVPEHIYEYYLALKRKAKELNVDVKILIPANVRELIEKVSKLYVFNQRLKDRKVKSLDYQYNQEIPPYPYQKIGTTLLVYNPFYALFCEQGTGKTRMAIDALCEIARRRKDIRKVLVATPNSVIFSWVSDFEKFATFPYELFPAIDKKKETIHKWVEAKRDKLSTSACGDS
jgi:hypothetical protein